MYPILNIVGLILNILGVVLLFWHGVPPKYNEGYVEQMPSKEFTKHKMWGNFGFSLIILGFIMQLISAIKLLP